VAWSPPDQSTRFVIPTQGGPWPPFSLLTYNRPGTLTNGDVDRIESGRGYRVNENNWGCIKQAALGCGGLVVLAVAFPVVLAVMTLLPMNRAVSARTELEAAFGTQESFVPPASGVPSPDRIEAFLAVRRALAQSCNDLRDADQAVAKMEAFDGQDDVSKTAVLRQAMSTTKTMMGVGPSISHFYETRNQALGDAGLGLGEYTYLYVLAYGDKLVDPAAKLHLFGPETTNERIRGALRSILRHQLERARDEGVSDESLGALTAEIGALERDPNRIPWQDGLPLEIQQALLPYRQELDGLLCAPTMPLELMINVKRSLAIESM
jgi:hypothetical protein